MSNYPRIAIAGSNQFPAVSTAIPSQLPVYEIVDGTGAVITNLGNGPADGVWTNMTLINSWTAGTITPQYMKDSRGRIFLRGRVVAPSGLAAVSPCWTAPADHRPITASFYFDWTAGGTPAGTNEAPKTIGTISNAGAFTVNYLNTGAADLTAGKISDLARMSWPST